MSATTQSNRAMRVETVLGPDVLLLAGFRGSEAVSEPFRFTIEMLCERDDLDPRQILRTPMVLSLDLQDGAKRSFHGLCARFTQGGRRGEFTSYRAELVPWLWFLSLSRESRIYQDKSVLEIVEQVFRDQGYTDFDIRCTRSYAPREYCVQYRETHLAFISRLLEEEGIFYFFEHSADKHVLVLGDHNVAFQAAPGADAIPFSDPGAYLLEDAIVRLERESAVHAGRYTLSDYSFEQPQAKLESSLLGDGREEIYDYPGGYRTAEDGERLVRLRLEAEEVEGETLLGAGTCRQLMSGHSFRVRDAGNAAFNGEYVATRVEHAGRAESYRTGGAPADGPGWAYSNEFRAVPKDVAFRPRARTPKPVIYGTQPALVVGVTGEELWTDEYGRIKVQFYWDRQGQRDEKSSCWVRVATPWGGAGWGSVSVPRIGNEVVVAFEEGDPDRPLVIGSVYNADQMPPYALPGAGITMGLKSRSSPGGGGTNEITVTDTKGKELLTIHAQHDMVVNVGNAQRNTVAASRTTTIGGDDVETVGGEQSTQVGKDQKTKVGGSQSVKVSGAQSITTGASRAMKVAGSEKHTVGASLKVKTGGSLTISSGGPVLVKAPVIGLTAQAMVKIKVGGSCIKVTGAGIEISGPTVKSKAAGPNIVKGAVIKLN